MRNYNYSRPTVTWKRPSGEMITVRKGANKIKCKLMLVLLLLTDILFLAEEVSGAEIQLHKVTRSEMGSYMCIATNGVPPAVGKTVQLNVNCKYFTPSSRSPPSSLIFQFSPRCPHQYNSSEPREDRSKASNVWPRPLLNPSTTGHSALEK